MSYNTCWYKLAVRIPAASTSQHRARNPRNPAYRNFCGALGLGQSVASGHLVGLWSSFQSLPVPYPGSSPVASSSVVAGSGWCVAASGMGLEGVGFHVAHPFAGAPHVLLCQSVAHGRHAFGQAVDPVLQPVRGGRHWPAGQQPEVEEREQDAVAVQAFQPPAASAQPLVHPPSLPTRCLRVRGIVLGVGAFRDEVPPSRARRPTPCPPPA